MPAPYEITPSQLWKRIGLPDAPVIADLRIGKDYAEDPRRVPGAIVASHTDLDDLAARAQDAPLVIYCQRGRKISQGAAAALRTPEREVLVLEGGQIAWIDAGLPTVSLPADFSGESLWVTRHRPKIDRVACPWLLRRFVDRASRILYVPPADVPLVAEKFDATPFDIEDVALSHHDGRCSFDAFLRHFELEAPALQRIARIIEAADTDNLGAQPQAAGLLAICLGLSRQYRNDQAQLEAALPVFDALYLWARDAVDEVHDWPNPGPRGKGAGK